MKILTLTIITLISQFSFAADITFKPFSGAVTLYSEAHHKPVEGCDVGTSLVLDEGALVGKVGVLKNFVSGTCRLGVNVDPRIYQLTATGDARCGIITYVGYRMTESGRVDIKITDYRDNQCRFLAPAQIKVEETNGQTINSLFSYDLTSALRQSP